MRHIKPMCLMTLMGLMSLMFPAPVHAGELANQFTISLYVNPQTSIASKALMGKAEEVRLFTDASGLPSCQIKSTTWQTVAAGTTALTLNTWSHVSCTYDKAVLRLYVNGVQAGTSNLTAALDDTANNFLVGEDDSADALYTNFTGTVDQFQVYNYARTQKQIVSDMNAGHPAVGSPVGSAVGYWKFDEGVDNACSGGTNDACNSGSSGSTLDGAGSGFASPATSTSGWTQSGKFGKALIFDGTDDVVTVTNANPIDMDTGLANFTFSAWVYATGAGEGNAGQILQKGASTYLRVDNPSGSNLDVETNLDLATSDANVNVSAPIIINAWNHIAATWDGTTLTVYINGRSRGTGTGSGAISSDANNLLIGGTTTANFAGTIDDLKVYGYALTADEVKLDYNRGSALVLGSLSDTSGVAGGSVASNSASAEYCIPGDTTSCAAPVGRWDFEEKTGTSANDSSGNANTGTITAATYTPGKYGSSLSFNGTSAEATVSDSTSLHVGDIFTLEAWIKRFATGNSESIMDSTTNGWSFQINTSNQIRPVKRGVAQLGVSTTTITDTSNWHHVVWTKNGSTNKIYIDGILDTGTLSDLTMSNSTAVSIGSASGSNFFHGSIDHVRIFNYARSAAQIAWDYNRGAPVAWYKMDDCQGPTVHDSSGNNNVGTVNMGSGGTTTVGTCTASSTFWGGSGGTGAGKVNYAPTFDGTDDYIKLPSLSTLSQYSVSLWFKLATTWNSASTGDQMIYEANSGDASPDTYLWLTSSNNGKLVFRTYNFNNLLTTTNSWNAGQWYHIVITYDGTKKYIYVNGNLENSVTVSIAGLKTTSRHNLGTYATTSGYYFNGQMDDARIYNYALTATQVKLLYSGGAVNFGPSTGAP